MQVQSLPAGAAQAYTTDRSRRTLRGYRDSLRAQTNWPHGADIDNMTDQSLWLVTMVLNCLLPTQCVVGTANKCKLLLLYKQFHACNLPPQ